MPVKTGFTTEQYLKGVPLPQHGKSYTVIPHGYAIEHTKTYLEKEGFEIQQAFYKSTQDGQVAQGVYHLTYGTDPDMGLMFAWSNSYDKSRRFKCAVGGHVFACMNGVVRGDLGSFTRKHTGSALHDAEEQIRYQLAGAKEHFEVLIKDKEMLKNITLSPAQQGNILGRLFAEYEVLTLTQTGIVKREMDKPSHDYNCHPDSAWAMYNHITLALKESHPTTYLQDHEVVHQFFVDEFGQLVTNVPEEPVQVELEFAGGPSNGVLFL